MLVQITYAQSDTVLPQHPASEAPEALRRLVRELERQKDSLTREDADLGIDGLVVDETKTKTGRDFYELFYRDWEPPPEAKGYSILIIERPYRLTTTEIEVKINETQVFQSALQPRGDIVEMLCEYALQRTYHYLKDYERIKKELDGEERSGSGIY